MCMALFFLADEDDDDDDDDVDEQVCFNAVTYLLTCLVRRGIRTVNQYGGVLFTFTALHLLMIRLEPPPEVGWVRS